MTLLSKLSFFNSLEKRKVLILYFLYHLTFIFLHISLISLFSFFHFLLDHDMGIIENWLNRNSWEILIMAKGLSFFLFSKGIILNQYYDRTIRSFFQRKEMRLGSRTWAISIFILVIYYAFIIQFGGGIQANQFKEELVYASFLGSLSFYFLEYGILKILMEVYKVPKKEISYFLFPTFLIFFLSSKMILPYLDKYTIFLALHFISIFYIGLLGNLSDYLVYSFAVIGPFSSFYGIDIVWDNAYSLFGYQGDIPSFGIAAIWLIALVYYRHSRRLS